MKTEPVTIKLKAGAEPLCLTTARRVPFPLMNAVKAELNNMVESGVIRYVTDPTDWCAAVVPVIKKTGAVRICVDVKQLNTAVRREHHMLPSLEDIAPKLAGSKVFSTLDAASGFLANPDRRRQPIVDNLHNTISTLCILQTAIWNFLRPRDIPTQDVDTTRRTGRVEVIMDDILVHGRNREEHDARLNAVLRIINDSGLKLNPKKCVFRKTELTYFGHLIGGDGIKPDPEMVEALLELSRPNNISELRTVLGMFQYLTKFVYDMSSVMKPMTDLLKSDVVWSWGKAQQGSFDKTKELLSYYDSMKLTLVRADAVTESVPC